MPSVLKSAEDGHPFGSALRQYRNTAGMTLAALASELGRCLGSQVDPQKVNGWELRHMPNLSERREVVECLEDILGVPDHGLRRLAYPDLPGDERLTRLEERFARMEETQQEILTLLRQLGAAPPRGTAPRRP